VVLSSVDLTKKGSIKLGRVKATSHRLLTYRRSTHLVDKDKSDPLAKAQWQGNTDDLHKQIQLKELI
jgi:hypothetical protein